MSQAEVKLDLSRIVFIGRTFEEYVKMFDLSAEQMAGKRILDCPSGACSFTAVASRQGVDVTAADTAYYYAAEELERKGLQDIEHAMEHMEKAQANYIWDEYQSVAGLKLTRMQALRDCAADMKQAPERYVPAVLPELPFSDEAFDITLSAHFLFMYADRLDYDFHVRTIRELMRVTREEIRIFPLADLSNRKYEHARPLIEYIDSQGWDAEEVRVPYRFQKNADSMLKLSRRA